MSPLGLYGDSELFFAPRRHIMGLNLVQRRPYVFHRGLCHRCRHSKAIFVKPLDSVAPPTVFLSQSTIPGTPCCPASVLLQLWPLIAPSQTPPPDQPRDDSSRLAASTTAEIATRSPRPGCSRLAESPPRFLHHGQHSAPLLQRLAVLPQPAQLGFQAIQRRGRLSEIRDRPDNATPAGPSSPTPQVHIARFFLQTRRHQVRQAGLWVWVLSALPRARTPTNVHPPPIPLHQTSQLVFDVRQPATAGCSSRKPANAFLISFSLLRMAAASPCCCLLQMCLHLGPVDSRRFQGQYRQVPCSRAPRPQLPRRQTDPHDQQTFHLTELIVWSTSHIQSDAISFGRLSSYIQAATATTVRCWPLGRLPRRAAILRAPPARDRPLADSSPFQHESQGPPDAPAP